MGAATSARYAAVAGRLLPNADWLCRNCAWVSLGRGWQALQVIE